MNISLNILKENQTIREALDRLNHYPEGATLFILDDKEKLVGTLTEGDIRRALIKDLNPDEIVSKIMFRNFKYLQNQDLTWKQAKEYKKQKIQLIPILNNEGRLIDVLDLSAIKSLLPIEACIMAGGKGERLRPLTANIPKPMLHVGSKPILEHIIDHLANFGIKQIHLSVNYLAENIINYFGDGSKKNLKINYIREQDFMGTIGSLSLIENFSADTILILNSDLLTNIDLEAFYSFFEEQDADLGIATIPYSLSIPYAILELEEHIVYGLSEKPTYVYQANAGIYLVKQKHLALLPNKKFFNATDFIEMLLQKNLKIVQYQIMNYWLDIGSMPDYQKAQQDIQYLKF